MFLHLYADLTKFLLVCVTWQNMITKEVKWCRSRALSDCPHFTQTKLRQAPSVWPLLSMTHRWTIHRSSVLQLISVRFPNSWLTHLAWRLASSLRVPDCGRSEVRSQLFCTSTDRQRRRCYWTNVHDTEYMTGASTSFPVSKTSNIHDTECTTDCRYIIPWHWIHAWCK